MLAELADSGAVVALLIADERLLEMPAVDFLARAHDLHPGARRVLLVERGDWSATHPAVCAMALGRIDYHLYVPWYPLERGLYPAVSEFLAAWDKSREPSAAVVRIVGGAHSSRAHHLRDLLTRGGVPYLFFADDSDLGRKLLREHGLEGASRPVAFYYDGTVLVDPSGADLLATFGFQTNLGRRPAMWSSSAPGRPAWRPASTRRLRGSVPSFWNRFCPVGRPGRAR
jgi:thioredoxin reductase (NADPH)